MQSDVVKTEISEKIIRSVRVISLRLEKCFEITMPKRDYFMCNILN